jgi:hypothetical protein
LVRTEKNARHAARPDLGPIGAGSRGGFRLSDVTSVSFRLRTRAKLDDEAI